MLRVFVLSLFFIIFPIKANIISFTEKEECVPDTDNCISSLTIITSDGIFYLENLFGEFYLSKTNGQILNCGGYKTYLINSDKSLLVINNKKSINFCGVTIDHKYYFTVDENLKLIVFNKNSEIIFTKKVKIEENVQFKIKNVEYEIHIPMTPRLF